jgi:hypothetical protein
MAAAGGGVLGEADAVRSRRSETSQTNVADLLKNLNLTAEEGEVLEFSDGEEDNNTNVVEWALVSKILSPSRMHPCTIHQAMHAPWEIRMA